ncbi:MAG TPA: hypothetical protein VF720_05050 [Candidatus Eisenbacteria bacterium]
MKRFIVVTIGATLALLLSLVALPGSSRAQVVNPGDLPLKPDSTEVHVEHARTWEMPEVIVFGKSHKLREEQRIGPYRQPRWTATRRFTTTRTYVIPPGKAEFEFWVRPTFKNDGTVEMRSLWELEFGLPHRFQLDLYLRTDQVLDPGGEPASHGQQIEVRWALADWGKIWGNPTLYLEWVNLYDSPDKIEPKLLLGGQLAEGWQAGANLVGEFEMGGEREYEYEFTGGLGHPIIDSQFSIGLETRLAWADVASDRGNFSQNFRLGPSIQFRPLNRMTINVAALAGLTEDSDDAQMFVNTGWEF